MRLAPFRAIEEVFGTGIYSRAASFNLHLHEEEFSIYASPILYGNTKAVITLRTAIPSENETPGFLVAFQLFFKR